MATVQLRRPRDTPEERLQKSCVRFLQAAAPPGLWWTHPHNEGKRTRAEAARAKAMGQRAGTPDLILCWQGRFLGMEIKMPTGRVSPAQKDCHAALTEAGADVAIVRSVDDAYRALTLWGIPMIGRPT